MCHQIGYGGSVKSPHDGECNACREDIKPRQGRTRYLGSTIHTRCLDLAAELNADRARRNNEARRKRANKEES